MNCGDNNSIKVFYNWIPTVIYALELPNMPTSYAEHYLIINTVYLYVRVFWGFPVVERVLAIHMLGFLCLVTYYVGLPARPAIRTHTYVILKVLKLVLRDAHRKPNIIRISRARSLPQEAREKLFK